MRQRAPRRLRLRHSRRRQRRPVPERQGNAEGAARRPRAGAQVTGTDRRGRPEGTIVEVVDRANTHVIGRLLNENGVWIVAPEDKRIGQDILVSGSPGKAKAGQIVSVELIEQPSRFKQPAGRIVEVLGELDDPGMEIEIAVRKFGVPHIFSAARSSRRNKLPERSARRRPGRPRRPARRAAGDDRRRRRARLRRCGLLRTGQDRPHATATA
jgi:exoribonuclease R